MEEPSGGEAPVPQDAIALEASNKRLHAVAKKLKALLDTTQEELSLNKSRVSELELAARASTTKSVLSTLLGVPASEAEGLEARVAARVPIVEPSGETRVWCCITAPDGTLADWIPEDDLLSRVPRFAAPVRQCELHTTPGEAAALRARVAEPVEELRKYRVRAEALLRQRDAELATARERVTAMEGGGGGGGGGSGGVGDALGGTPSTTPSSAAAAAAATAPGSASSSSSSSSSSSGSGESLESLQRRLNEAHSQAQRLLAARGDLLERERAAKEGEEEACREAALARKEASLWQAKWAEAVGAAPPGSSASAAAAAAVAAVAAGGGGGGGGEGNEWLGVDGLGGGGGGSGGVGSSSTSGSGSGSGSSSSSSSAAAIAEARAPLQLELTKTQGEYLAYRRRAVAMIKEKDDQMKRLAEDMSALKGRLADASAAVAAANAASNAAAASSQLLHHHRVVGSPGGGGDHTGSSSSSSSHTHNHHPLVSSPLHSPLPLQSGLGGRGGGAGTPPTLQQQHTPGGTATTIPDLARWLYLRALLLKYLGEGVGDAGIRKSLEPPLFMVLGLSPSDVAHVLRSRASAAAGAGVAGLEDITAASPALGQAVSAVSGTLTGLWSLIGSAASNAASAAAAATATAGGGSGSGSGGSGSGSGSVGGLSFGGGGGNGYAGGGQGQEGGAGAAALAGLAAAAGMPPASTLAQPQAQVDYALELLGNEKQ